jgi:hypothetical protein
MNTNKNTEKPINLYANEKSVSSLLNYSRLSGIGLKTDTVKNGGKYSLSLSEKGRKGTASVLFALLGFAGIVSFKIGDIIAGKTLLSGCDVYNKDRGKYFPILKTATKEVKGKEGKEYNNYSSVFSGKVIGNFRNGKALSIVITD